MGRLTSPHQIFESLESSRTMNLSCGERPVCLPVRTTSGPSAATIPSPARMACSYSSAVERLARIVRPNVVGGVLGDWIAVTALSLAGRQVRFDPPERKSVGRPAARDRGPKAPGESAYTVDPILRARCRVCPVNDARRL